MPNKPTSTGSEPARMGGDGLTAPDLKDGLTAPDLKQDEQKKDSRDEKVTSKNKYRTRFCGELKIPTE
jgi:hypothetical protein